VIKCFRLYPIRANRVIILLGILLHFSCFSQDWLHDTLDLKGSVKTLKYSSTEYISDDEDEWWISNNEYEYNRNGFLVRSNLDEKIFDTYHHGIYRVFDESGTMCLLHYELNNGDTMSATRFIYDSLDRVIEAYYYRADFSNSHYYVYDNQGKLSQEYGIVNTNDTISNIYKYDDAGRKVEDLDTSYSCVILKSWVYDANDNVLQEKSDLKKAPSTIKVKMCEDGTYQKEIIENNPDDHRSYQINYTYNELNQIEHEVKMYLDGRILYDVLLEYNKRGDVIAESYLNADNPKEDRFKLRFKYKYDAEGNWISKRQYYSGDLEKEEYRVIEYY
jgi:hypothetical protein